MIGNRSNPVGIGYGGSPEFLDNAHTAIVLPRLAVAPRS